MTRPATVIVVVGFVVALLFLHYRPKSADIVRDYPVRADVPLVISPTGPPYAYPKRDLTPGVTDPSVTEDNIQLTICVSGYTKKVRPPERLTNRLKLQIMAAYGINGNARDYELDHFIPLELGGCPDCIANLWPEPYEPIPGARQKDLVENFLHRRVCSREITLREAQDIIRNDWVRVYADISQGQ